MSINIDIHNTRVPSSRGKDIGIRKFEFVVIKDSMLVTDKKFKTCLFFSVELKKNVKFSI